jgi:diguanylate cyclase (GGDEF)-like protein
MRNGMTGVDEGLAVGVDHHQQHFSCSMSAVLIGFVRSRHGERGVAEMLRRAQSTRSPEELLDTGNWLSAAEAEALWDAAREITHHPQLARRVGEETVLRLLGSPVAEMLRSLGSAQRVYEMIATTAGRFSTVTRLEVLGCGAGWAEIVATNVPSVPRSIDHCGWTHGLLSQPPVLFGLAPAIVEHDQCQALGAGECRYQVRWIVDPDPDGRMSSEVSALEGQLQALQERLHNAFATATDLIAADEIDSVLTRITARAAVEVRAPRYLLSVQLPGAEAPYRHGKGIDSAAATACAEHLARHGSEGAPEHWLPVPVRSQRHDYGWLVALQEEGGRFFPQERDLLEVYARYAAAALDSAGALAEARRRSSQSHALLALARALAAAGTTAEVASRLVESVPAVVGCDDVRVLIWEERGGRLVPHSCSEPDLDLGNLAARLLAASDNQPVLLDCSQAEEVLMLAPGARAAMLLPLRAGSTLLGALLATVRDRPERLQPSRELLDRASGVAAQATTALQNGRLVDAITHQALHDPLTGLANRRHFTEDLRDAVALAHREGEALTLFYLDLDGFKPVNDEFGHDVGDALLVAIGERLRQVTRASDAVARLGGDEFAVLVREPLEDADSFVTRLRLAIDAPFVIAGHRLRVSVSVGRAVFPLDATGAEELVRHADEAMFEAKRTRGRLVPDI